jgi:hypothetical protein
MTEGAVCTDRLELMPCLIHYAPGLGAIQTALPDLLFPGLLNGFIRKHIDPQIDDLGTAS